VGLTVRWSVVYYTERPRLWCVVQGSGLETECMESAVIWVGVERCNRTTVISDERLQCTPPTQQPQPTDSTHQLPSVVVSLIHRVAHTHAHTHPFNGPLSRVSRTPPSHADQPLPSVLVWPTCIQGGPKKQDHILVTTVLSNLNRFTKLCS